MAKIGWVTDDIPSGAKGREWSIKNFRDAKPEFVDLVDIDLEKPEECDLYVIHSIQIPKNLPLFPKSLVPGKQKLRPVVMYAHQWDIYPSGATSVIYQSPLHAETHRFGKKFVLAPPIVESDYQTTGEVERKPNTAIFVGEAVGDEGFDMAVKWAEVEKVETYFIGAGFQQTVQANFAKFRGVINHEDVPGILNQCQYMVHMPRSPRPFPRAVGEGLLAGCEVVVSGKLGIESFASVEEALDGAKTSNKKFWDIVLEHLD